MRIFVEEILSENGGNLKLDFYSINLGLVLDFTVGRKFL